MSARLILASGSASRRALLSAAGLSAEHVAPHVDEMSVKESLARDGVSPRGMADALAQLKAVKVSRQHPEALVLGADQILVRQDGRCFDKPVDRAAARDQLLALQGQQHQLITAAVIAEQGRAVWRVMETARLTMRPLGAAFIEHYLDTAGEAVLGSVGCYHYEGIGVQLFSRVEGLYHTILGLPMLPLLDYLRLRAVIAG